MPPTTWTPEQSAILREMAARPLPGATAGEMANAVGKTRSAVIARISREKIFWTRGEQQLGGAAHRAKRQIMRKPTPAPAKRKAPPMISPHPPDEPIAPPPSPRAELIEHLRAQGEPPTGATTLFCLQENACRFPMWGHNETPAEYLFCGQPTADGPYCLHHFNLTHVAAAPRRRAA